MRVLFAALLVPCVLPAQTITRVEVTPAETTMVVGSAIKLRAVAQDDKGATVAQAPVWAATPFDIGQIDSTGTLTAIHPGEIQVFAIVGGRPGRATVRIAQRPPARLVIESTEGNATVVGGTVQLEVGGMTSANDAVPVPSARWRSRTPAIAEVSPNGLVTARAPGRATIVAESGALSATTEIVVRANPVRTVFVDPVTRPARTGDVVRLTAATRDARGGTVAGVPVRWSVSGSGAQVDADGYFVAEDPGIYTVTASVGSVGSATAVQVVPRNDPRRLTSVAHSALPGGTMGAEVWPFGDVAYVSTISSRVYVFDIRDPSAPKLTDSLVVDAHLVNDVSLTEDGRLGVLTREGASNRRNGLVFFDATDPRHPKVISEFTETLTGGVHSAFIWKRYVFATDDATGSLRIIDFSDPKQPKQIARWETPSRGSRMLHDVYVRDGLAYLAYWRDGLIILDVGNGMAGGTITAPKEVSRFVYDHSVLYPPDFVAGTHAVYPAGKYIFIADESLYGAFDISSRERLPTRGIVHVIDASDIRNLRKVAQYDPIEFGAHNLWVEDDLLYIGAYDGGVRVLDVSGDLRGELREQGRVIGAMYTGALDGYRPNQALAWSAIPHRGHVMVSDINTGFWVAKVVSPQIP
ncbi:MAG TPA: Ig-like domain-containing protein [Gemmatimonadaceae bacterium]|nr:Ig-like domain-containing protein [Gemmatimonadaceae bacterium]